MGLLHSVVLAPPTSKGAKTMRTDYIKKLEQIDRHLAEHPKDYQASIARLKAYSDAVEHQMYLKRIARLKRVAEFRREQNNEE